MEAPWNVWRFGKGVGWVSRVSGFVARHFEIPPARYCLSLAGFNRAFVFLSRTPPRRVACAALVFSWCKRWKKRVIQKVKDKKVRRKRKIEHPKNRPKHNSEIKDSMKGKRRRSK